jgi:hypothetical protein
MMPTPAVVRQAWNYDADAFVVENARAKPAASFSQLSPVALTFSRL